MLNKKKEVDTLRAEIVYYIDELNEIHEVTLAYDSEFRGIDSVLKVTALLETIYKRKEDLRKQLNKG